MMCYILDYERTECVFLIFKVLFVDKMTYWGLNSAIATNTPYGSEFFYNHVVSELGRTPEFWGRYIGYRPNQIQRSEIAFLLDDHQCRIAIIYNGVRRRMGAYISGPAGYRSGHDHAEAAVSLAIGLSVPNNVRIYCDLEGWRATPEWLRGWFDAMYMSPYVGMGGIYGRTAEITLAQAQDPLQITPLLSEEQQRLRLGDGYWSGASSTAIREQETDLDPLMRHAAGLGGRP